MIRIVDHFHGQGKQRCIDLLAGGLFRKKLGSCAGWLNVIVCM